MVKLGQYHHYTHLYIHIYSVAIKNYLELTSLFFNVPLNYYTSTPFLFSSLITCGMSSLYTFNSLLYRSFFYCFVCCLYSALHFPVLFIHLYFFPLIYQFVKSILTRICYWIMVNAPLNFIASFQMVSYFLPSHRKQF